MANAGYKTQARATSPPPPHTPARAANMHVGARCKGCHNMHVRARVATPNLPHPTAHPHRKLGDSDTIVSPLRAHIERAL